MSAAMSYCDSASATTGASFAPSSTATIYLITSASDWPAMPPPITPRRKGRTPFYRPLFEQCAPRTIEPICPRLVRPAWSPQMGRFEARP